VATVTPLGIAVLALLAERPMHPYEMYRLLLERHEDRRVKIRPGSLYHTVDRMAENGLVEAIGTERDGGRPERTTYQVTDTGRQELTDRIRTLLATPVNEYPQFPVALGEAHNLPLQEVIELLSTRVRRIEGELAGSAALLRSADERGVEEAYLLAAHFAQELLTTERDWLTGLIGRLERKELRWPSEDAL
jgi:DNA-binding PadR family transcriptional regulator